VPGWIPCADDGFGATPGEHLRELAGVSPVDSPASVDDLARQLDRVAGVVSVRWRVPRDFRSYPEWFDQQIQAHLSGAESVRPPPARSRWEPAFPSRAVEVSGPAFDPPRGISVELGSSYQPLSGKLMPGVSPESEPSDRSPVRRARRPLVSAKP
jgi:hypothetical protein